MPAPLPPSPPPRSGSFERGGVASLPVLGLQFPLTPPTPARGGPQAVCLLGRTPARPPAHRASATVIEE